MSPVVLPRQAHPQKGVFEILAHTDPHHLGASAPFALSTAYALQEATENLNVINQLAQQGQRGVPWALSFSYGRALQVGEWGYVL